MVYDIYCNQPPGGRPRRFGFTLVPLDRCEWYQYPHLMPGKKANNQISQNIQLFILQEQTTKSLGTNIQDIVHFEIHQVTFTDLVAKEGEK